MYQMAMKIARVINAIEAEKIELIRRTRKFNSMEPVLNQTGTSKYLTLRNSK